MNTIHDKWVAFQNEVVPKDASPVQRNEMKKAFYAGAFGMMQLSNEMVNHSEEAAFEMLKGWDEEIVLFVKQATAKEGNG